jgi:hypothetical protein
MIQLHPDYLLFDLPNGDAVPCSAESVTVELIGDAAQDLDPEIIKNAAAAVLHYFQQDLKRDHVSVGEFSDALEKVLRGFGLQVGSPGNPASTEPPAQSDLDSIAQETAEAGELFFFQSLRDEVKQQLENAPAGRLSFSGLRPCVKHLLGAARWSPRCEGMSDQIVSYVRDCLSHETADRDCAVIIR